MRTLVTHVLRHLPKELVLAYFAAVLYEQYHEPLMELVHHTLGR